jgi:CheY-like chemotaxis protein
VNDTGIGFEPGSAEHLFQPFEQGGRNITRQFGGLGLGLAITRSIIKAHGGSIHADSRGLWKGATFSFQLPVQKTGKPAPRNVPAPTATRKTARKQILLVEDHKDTRTSLELLLKKARHDVISAASAKEALELAAQNEFDLVISDIGLPDQSGLELMRQLKNEFNLKGIGLSGFGMDEDIAKGRSAGFIQYLTKPVHFAELKQIIAEI